jgi:hypothetical protein
MDFCSPDFETRNAIKIQDEREGLPFASFPFHRRPDRHRKPPSGGTYYQAQQSYSVHNSIPAAVVGRSSRIVGQGFRKSSARAVVKLDHAWGRWLSSSSPAGAWRPVPASDRGERVSITGQTKGWQRLTCPKLCSFCKRVLRDRSNSPSNKLVRQLSGSGISTYNVKASRLQFKLVEPIGRAAGAIGTCLSSGMRYRDTHRALVGAEGPRSAEKAHPQTRPDQSQIIRFAWPDTACPTSLKICPCSMPLQRGDLRDGHVG